MTEVNYLKGSDKKYSKYLTLDNFINKIIFEYKMQYDVAFVYSEPHLLDDYKVAHRNYNLEQRDKNLENGSNNGSKGYANIRDKESHKDQFNSHKTLEIVFHSR